MSRRCGNCGKAIERLVEICPSCGGTVPRGRVARSAETPQVPPAADSGDVVIAELVDAGQCEDTMIVSSAEFLEGNSVAFEDLLEGDEPFASPTQATDDVSDSIPLTDDAPPAVDLASFAAPASATASLTDGVRAPRVRRARPRSARRSSAAPAVAGALAVACVTAALGSMVVLKPADLPASRAVWTSAGDALVVLETQPGAETGATLRLRRDHSLGAGPPYPGVDPNGPISWGGTRLVAFHAADEADRIVIVDAELGQLAHRVLGRNPSFAANGTALAYERDVRVGEGDAAFTQAEIFVFDLETGDHTRITREGGARPAWSSAGPIAFERDRRREVVRRVQDVEAGRIHRVIERQYRGTDLLVLDPQRSAKARVVASGGINAHARWTGAEGRSLTWVRWEQRGAVERRREGPSPDWTTAALWRSDPDGEPGSVLALDEVAGGSGALSWSPDGELLVFADPTGGLALLDLATGARAPLQLGSAARAARPQFSPDGSRLAYVVALADGPRVVVASWAELDPRRS